MGAAISDDVSRLLYLLAALNVFADALCLTFSGFLSPECL